MAVDTELDPPAHHGACPRGGLIAPALGPPREPIYTLHTVRAVHRLHYGWTGWIDPPSTDFPLAERLAEALDDCRPCWSEEGLSLDRWLLDDRDGRVQLLFTVSPTVAPAFCVSRAKGRLDHVLRGRGGTVRFRRQIGFRTLGENTRDIVDAYIARQAPRSNYVDPRFRRYLESFTRRVAETRLDLPASTGHGRYWYNLHVVLVVADRRYPITREENFVAVRDACPRIAAKKGHALAELSVMPDHVHLALRGNIEHSPAEIALGFLNNLAYVLGYNRFWSEEFYVGTFSEYGLDAVRSRGTPRKPSDHRPTGTSPAVAGE